MASRPGFEVPQERQQRFTTTELDILFLCLNQLIHSLLSLLLIWSATVVTLALTRTLVTLHHIMRFVKQKYQILKSTTLALSSH